MTIIIQEITREDPTKKVGQIPTIIPWKDAKMIRNQSIRASVKEIISFAKTQQVAQVNIIGDPGSGKTTLAETLAHLVHKIADIPFAVKVLDKNDLVDFEGTINSLEPTNWVLVFDDISFLEANFTKREIETIKQKLTEVRHLPGGHDVKIILIKNFHYSLGLTKYLRQSHFTYMTSVGSSETDNLEKMFGTKFISKVKQFQSLHHQAISKGKFTFRLGRFQDKKFWTYVYREPFIPLLFYNTQSLRYIVSPKRTWIDPICSVCEQPIKAPTMSPDIATEQFVKDLSFKFGNQIARSAVRITCFQNGINVYPKRVKQAMKYIEEYSKNQQCKFGELARCFNFDNERTRLDEKVTIN